MNKRLCKLFTKLNIPGRPDDEVFVEVDNYSRYLVSNYGLIYDTKLGRISNSHQYFPRSNGKPYLRTNMIDDNGKKADVRNSRAVLMGFRPLEDYNNIDCHHKDENTLNNNLNNLQWISHLENCREHYYFENGIDNYQYTDQNIHKICQLLCQNYSYDQIAMEVFGRPLDDTLKSYITAIRGKKFRTDISDQYNLPNKLRNTALFSDDDLRKICELIVQGYGNMQIADMLKGIIWDDNTCSREQISALITKLKSKQRFTRITDDYF